MHVANVVVSKNTTEASKIQPGTYMCRNVAPQILNAQNLH